MEKLLPDLFSAVNDIMQHSHFEAMLQLVSPHGSLLHTQGMYAARVFHAMLRSRNALTWRREIARLYGWCASWHVGSVMRLAPLGLTKAMAPRCSRVHGLHTAHVGSHSQHFPGVTRKGLGLTSARSVPFAKRPSCYDLW